MKLRSVVLAGLALAAAACRASVQTREARTNSGENCRSAAAQVATGAESFAAFVTLGWCDETGPAVVAARWNSFTPRDSLTLRAFLFASGNLRDRRIFEAAYVAAIDSARPQYERAAALLVLVAQLDSSAAIMPGPGLDGDPWRAMLMHSFHGGSPTGTHALPSDARARLLALTRSITGERRGSLARMREPLYGAATSAYYTLQRSSP